MLSLVNVGLPLGAACVGVFVGYALSARFPGARLALVFVVPAGVTLCVAVATAIFGLRETERLVVWAMAVLMFSGFVLGILIHGLRHKGPNTPAGSQGYLS